MVFNLPKMQFHVVQPNIILTRNHGCTSGSKEQAEKVLNSSLYQNLSETLGTKYKKIQSVALEIGESAGTGSEILWKTAGRRGPVGGCGLLWRGLLLSQTPGSAQLSEARTCSPGETAGAIRPPPLEPLPPSSQPPHLLPA